jgi:hypothetical protein
VKTELIRAILGFLLLTSVADYLAQRIALGKIGQWIKNKILNGGKNADL